MAACWRLPSLGSDEERKKLLAGAKAPDLEKCPTWQVIRFLNQAGRCPLAFRLPGSAC